jgi:hypothetical protein
MKRANGLAVGVFAAFACAQVVAQDAEALAEARGFRFEGRGNALVISDVAANRELKRIPVAAADGSRPSRVSTLRFSGERQSFIVGFEALPEVWEISIDPKSPDIYQGLVHDFRLGEGVPERGFLGVRRTKLDTALPKFSIDRTGSYVAGCRADSPAPACALAVLHLDVRRKIAQFQIPDEPDYARTRDAILDQRPWLELADRTGQVRWRIDLARDQLETVAR